MIALYFRRPFSLCVVSFVASNALAFRSLMERISFDNMEILNAILSQLEDWLFD